MIKPNNRTIATLVVLVFLLHNSLVVTSGICQEIDGKVNSERKIVIPSQVHEITRRQALLDYILALYSEEDGAFYGYMSDTPVDHRIGSYMHIDDIDDPFFILKRLNATGIIDWGEK